MVDPGQSRIELRYPGLIEGPQDRMGRVVWNLCGELNDPMPWKLQSIRRFEIVKAFFQQVSGEILFCRFLFRHAQLRTDLE